jgi:type I restriction enzyme S subunit
MGENKLPENWVETTIKEINLYKSKGVKPFETPETYFESYSVPIFSEGKPEITQGKEIKSSKQSVSGGEVLLCKINPRINRVWQVGNHSDYEKICSSEWIIVDTKNTIEHAYLKHVFSAPFYRMLLQSEVSGVGGSLTRARPKIVENYNFPLPPLPEQKRIVAKLDQLFAHLEGLKARLDKIPALLKDFRQAVLTQAVTGKLTEEWREGKGLGEWVEKKLMDLCNTITDGDHQAPPKVASGIPFLVISNVSKGYINFDSVTRFVPEEYYQNLKEARVPRMGDVLYTVTGSYGISLLVKSNQKFCFQRHIGIIKPNQEILSSKFLVHSLNSPILLAQAHEVATGTAQKTVSLRGLKNFKILLPSLEEQKEIVRRVDALFAKADAIEQGYERLKTQIEQLPQAILAKAFKGELVPQLPSDGDAQALLEEIKQLKEAAAQAKKKSKKKPRTKKA